MVMAVDRVSETVAVTSSPGYDQTSVYSQLEVSGLCRHKQEIKLKPVLAPVKYTDTAFVYINNTRKRFKSRVFYQPRTQPTSFAETTYATPRTTHERFVSYHDHHCDQTRRWFKTSVDIKPRKVVSSITYPDTSTVSSTSDVTSDTALVNGTITSSDSTNRGTSGSSSDSSRDISSSVSDSSSGLFNHYSPSYVGLGDSPGDVDENMNRRIPAFKEKVDPGASQVFIPKGKNVSGIAFKEQTLIDNMSDQVLKKEQSLLDSVADQLLTDLSDDLILHNGYTNHNGHVSGLSDL